MTAAAPPPTSPTPPGWSYNPAAWSQRLPIVVLAVIGFVLASYLAIYQWRNAYDWVPLETVWDPFFSGPPSARNGSERILNSPTSRLLPPPFTDAFLGALGYLADAVTGVIGGVRRWQTMPWIVILFGLLVGPLGGVSIFLVMLQPLLYDTFCTICCVTAILSIVMIGPAMDEMLASCQYLKRVRQEGKPFWPAFWGRNA